MLVEALLGLLLAALGAPWDLLGSLWVFTGLQEGPRGAPGLDFHCFLLLYEAKVQFSNKKTPILLA